MKEFVKFVVKVFAGAVGVAAGGRLIKNGLENASNVKSTNSQNTTNK